MSHALSSLLLMGISKDRHGTYYAIKQVPVSQKTGKALGSDNE
jgi:hypothetical protein